MSGNSLERVRIILMQLGQAFFFFFKLAAKYFTFFIPSHPHNNPKRHMWKMQTQRGSITCPRVTVMVRNPLCLLIKKFLLPVGLSGVERM